VLGLPGRGPADPRHSPGVAHMGARVGGANPAPDPEDGRAPTANHQQGRR
jgi:hypothetical protein